jgi:hypothetical protein
MAIVIVGIGMLILGVCLGIVLGAGIVVGRIRDYRDALPQYEQRGIIEIDGYPYVRATTFHPGRVVIGDLLDTLGV